MLILTGAMVCGNSMAMRVSKICSNSFDQLDAYTFKLLVNGSLSTQIEIGEIRRVKLILWASKLGN